MEGRVSKTEPVSPIPPRHLTPTVKIEPASPAPPNLTVIPKMEPLSPAPPENVTSFGMPEYYLLPVSPNGRVQRLVCIGLAPVGWQNQPAWQYNQFPVHGPICYQNKYYYLSNSY